MRMLPTLALLLSLPGCTVSVSPGDASPSPAPSQAPTDAPTPTLEPTPSPTPTAAPTPRTDADGDGFYAEQDCNDYAASVHPGAAVVMCNGWDDDCSNSLPDEYVLYRDADADGHGDPNVPMLTCSPSDFDGNGWSWWHDDCLDTDPKIPGDQEVLGDGLDNNCDGLIDNEH